MTSKIEKITPWLVVRWVEPFGSPPLPSRATQNKTLYNINITNKGQPNEKRISHQGFLK